MEYWALWYHSDWWPWPCDHLPGLFHGGKPLSGRTGAGQWTDGAPNANSGHQRLSHSGTEPCWCPAQVRPGDGRCTQQAGTPGAETETVERLPGQSWISVALLNCSEHCKQVAVWILVTKLSPRPLWSLDFEFRPLNFAKSFKAFRVSVLATKLFQNLYDPRTLSAGHQTLPGPLWSLEFEFRPPNFPTTSMISRLWIQANKLCKELHDKQSSLAVLLVICSNQSCIFTFRVSSGAAGVSEWPTWRIGGGVAGGWSQHGRKPRRSAVSPGACQGKG